jgi:hypothetical protein
LTQVRIDTNSTHLTVIVDGKDITQKINSYTLTQRAGGLSPQLTVEYACLDQLTFEGDAEVVHVCPRKAR